MAGLVTLKWYIQNAWLGRAVEYEMQGCTIKIELGISQFYFTFLVRTFQIP